MPMPPSLSGAELLRLGPPHREENMIGSSIISSMSFSSNSSSLSSPSSPSSSSSSSSATASPSSKTTMIVSGSRGCRYPNDASPRRFHPEGRGVLLLGRCQEEVVVEEEHEEQEDEQKAEEPEEEDEEEKKKSKSKSMVATAATTTTTTVTTNATIVTSTTTSTTTSSTTTSTITRTTPEEEAARTNSESESCCTRKIVESWNGAGSFDRSKRCEASSARSSASLRNHVAVQRKSRGRSVVGSSSSSSSSVLAQDHQESSSLLRFPVYTDSSFREQVVDATLRDVVSSVNSSTSLGVVTTGTIEQRNNRFIFSNASSSLGRATNATNALAAPLANIGPSTSSWNNSNNNYNSNHHNHNSSGNNNINNNNNNNSSNGNNNNNNNNNSIERQESDYIIDPIQGNAYYKGQFLGKGGFARVYLMTDVTNGNQYACKIIPKNRMQKIHMQKIAREIMIHKELNHANVVQMHHYFEDNVHVYMLLEACPRKSLMHVLKYRGKVTEPEARYYMKQMVTGVAYIHSQKVVHRDLKPGNMFLSDRMIVKIGDFGLATRPDGQRRRVTICGTPNYIAPEVLYKQANSYEADVWALGCILYALLVGQPPFDAATLKETYARICNNHYREVDDTIASRSGQDLIRWLLQPNPELRPSLERVKEHAYLTKEHVPASLPHTCCYQMPHSSIIEPTPSLSSVSNASRNQDMSKTQVWQSFVSQDVCQQEAMTTQQGAQYQHLMNQSQKSIQKDSKVSNWLVKKLPKLPRFRQRLSSVFCPDHKKANLVAQSVQMHRALETCVAKMKRSDMQHNPPTVEDVVPLFVTKWIDYSNKYGLGFQLSDKSVGVLFNDNTKISYTHDRRRVEYMTIDDEVTRYYREKDVPVPLQKKLELLRHFTEYMDDFLTEGGEIKYRTTTAKQSKKACVPRMRRWLRTDKAIVMELTVPLLQVNFFVDHTKMIVSHESGRGYLITYIDTGRHVSSYWLNDLRTLGCMPHLYERLYYVCKVTREFAELDNNTIA